MNQGYYGMDLSGKYGMAKSAAEERDSWRLIVVNLRYRYEDDR